MHDYKMFSCAFKQTVAAVMPRTSQALEASGALRREYLDEFFVHFFRRLLPPEDVRTMMDRIEARLADRAWLIHEAFSLGDIAAAPYVVRFEEIRPDEMERWPRAADWWARMRARPSFAEAVMEPYG